MRHTTHAIAIAAACCLLTACRFPSSFDTPSYGLATAIGYGQVAIAESPNEAATAPTDGPTPTVEDAVTRMRPGPDTPDWATRSLDAQVILPLPEEATSRAEAILIARRQAHEAAHRQIAKRLAALPAPQGGTLGDILAANPATRAQVERAIPACAYITDGLRGQDEYECHARFELGPVALLIWGQEEQAAPAGETDDVILVDEDPQSKSRPADVDRVAFERAVDDARRRLLERVKQTYLFPNYTIEDRMADDDAAAITVLDAVERAEVRRWRSARPGACEVEITLDLQRITDELKR